MAGDDTFRYTFLDHPGPIPYAHRGGSLEGPENSLGAMAHAIELGFRYLETDTQQTSDGVLVVLHDATLERTTDRTGAVAEQTWEQVRGARLRNPDGSLSDQTLPRLEELFETWPDARINVEAKDDRAVEALVALVRRFDAVERVCLGSFKGARTATLRAQLGPRLCTSCGPLDVVRLRLGPLGRLLGKVAAACAQVPVRQKIGPLPFPIVDKAFVKAAHGHGLPVHVWTIDDEAEMRRLLDLGVDGLMTDRPSLLRQVLVDRGQWSGG
jgi:glycerophosphoryl diester phosphodiesterase